MDGIDMTKYKAQFTHIIFITRRAILVPMVIFLVSPVWAVLQIHTFCLCSLLTLSFNGWFQPFSSKYKNFGETINELSVLIVSYFALQLLYSSYSVEMMKKVGYSIISVVSICIVIQFVNFTISILRATKRKILYSRKKYVSKSKSKRRHAILTKSKNVFIKKDEESKSLIITKPKRKIQKISTLPEIKQVK